MFNWNEFIKWSGWFIAVGFGIWEIIKYVRNLSWVKIKVSLEDDSKGGKDNLVVIEASNKGRGPINLTLAGLYFKDGPIILSDEIDIEIGPVYKRIPLYSFIELEVLKAVVKSIQQIPGTPKAEGICFMGEKGDKHIGFFSDKLKQALYK